MTASTPPPMYMSSPSSRFVATAGTRIAYRLKREAGLRAALAGHRPEETSKEVEHVPPRGVKKGTKRARQYEHIKDSLLDRGSSEDRAEEIAARTVNKERARTGEAAEPSRLSGTDISSGRRGGIRSHRKGPRGRTRDQLYEEARRRNIRGRSKMTKAELQKALGDRS